MSDVKRDVEDALTEAKVLSSALLSSPPVRVIGSILTLYQRDVADMGTDLSRAGQKDTLGNKIGNGVDDAVTNVERGLEDAKTDAKRAKEDLKEKI